MTTVVLPRPDYATHVFDSIAALRNDPKVIEAVEEAMRARREGRVQPWSKVKEELGIR